MKSIKSVNNKGKGECICDKCERRFVCWTTKRVFSDPPQQALYEAHIAEGLSPEDAVQAVKNFIEQEVLRDEMLKRRDLNEPPWDEPPKFPYTKEWVNWKSDMSVNEAKKDIDKMYNDFRSAISGKGQ